MMACTLLREGGLWVASWTVDGVPHMHACEDRQGAAQALHLATGVWLGNGDAPCRQCSGLAGVCDLCGVARGIWAVRS